MRRVSSIESCEPYQCVPAVAVEQHTELVDAVDDLVLGQDVI